MRTSEGRWPDDRVLGFSRLLEPRSEIIDDQVMSISRRRALVVGATVLAASGYDDCEGAGSDPAGAHPVSSAVLGLDAGVCRESVTTCAEPCEMGHPESCKWGSGWACFELSKSATDTPTRTSLAEKACKFGYAKACGAQL